MAVNLVSPPPSPVVSQTAAVQSPIRRRAGNVAKYAPMVENREGLLLKDLVAVLAASSQTKSPIVDANKAKSRSAICSAAAATNNNSNSSGKKCAPDGLQLTIASLNAATQEFSTLAEKMIAIAGHRSAVADDHINSNKNTTVNEKEKTESRIYKGIDDITLEDSKPSPSPSPGVCPPPHQPHLEEKLDKLLDSVVKIKADMHQKIDRLSRRVDQIRLDVQLNIDTTDRAVCNNVLELAGVPYRRGENLQLYFRRICAVLGYAEPDIPLVDVRRKRPDKQQLAPLDKTEAPSTTTTNNNTATMSHDEETSEESSNDDPTLITIEFIFKNLRDAFHRAYLRKRTIRLSDLGLQSERRVYINESLTKLNQKLKWLALRKKREGLLHAVYTVDGTVYVQQQPGQKGRRINSAAELE